MPHNNATSTLMQMLMPGVDEEMFPFGMEPKGPPRTWRDRLTITGSDAAARRGASNAREAFLSQMPNFGEAVTSIPGAIGTSLAEFGGGVSDIGSSIASRIGSGVEAGAGNVASSLDSMFGAGSAVAAETYQTPTQAAPEAFADRTDNSMVDFYPRIEDAEVANQFADLDVVTSSKWTKAGEAVMEHVGGWAGAGQAFGDVMGRMAMAAANPGVGRSVGDAVAGAFGEGVANLSGTFARNREYADEREIRAYIEERLQDPNLTQDERDLFDAFKRGGNDLARLQIAQQRTSAYNTYRNRAKAPKLTGRGVAPSRAALDADVENRKAFEVLSGGISQIHLNQMRDPGAYLRKAREKWLDETDQHYSDRIDYIERSTNKSSQYSESTREALDEYKSAPFSSFMQDKYGPSQADPNDLESDLYEDSGIPQLDDDDGFFSPLMDFFSSNDAGGGVMGGLYRPAQERHGMRPLDRENALSGGNPFSNSLYRHA